jgi:hypothetical protein
MRSGFCGIAAAVVLATSVSSVVVGQQLHLTPLTCSATIKSIGTCPDGGCGGVSDALLNQAKNRTDSPTGTPQVLHIQDFVDLDEPDDWLTRQERDSITDTEGREVRLMAFLKSVKTETSGRDVQLQSAQPCEY